MWFGTIWKIIRFFFGKYCNKEFASFSETDIVDLVEVAMHNDKNELKKMITISANKENTILSNIKSKCSC